MRVKSLLDDRQALGVCLFLSSHLGSFLRQLRLKTVIHGSEAHVFLFEVCLGGPELLDQFLLKSVLSFLNIKISLQLIDLVIQVEVPPLHLPKALLHLFQLLLTSFISFFKVIFQPFELIYLFFGDLGIHCGACLACLTLDLQLSYLLLVLLYCTFEAE